MPLELKAAAAILTDRSDWLRCSVRLFAWYADSETPDRLEILRLALAHHLDRERSVHRVRLDRAWRAFQASEERRRKKIDAERWR